ncbi:MAG: hypothetical protein IJ019_03090 [Alphaproteobacteria bacterium]|nr:hypothetical protein [Alphaproteobacteria bacterium]
MIFKASNSEVGRSMLEMLGVLAIVGILSVGGMSGYGVAMRKYKISSTKDAVLDTLKRYGELKNEGFEYYRIEGADAIEEIKEYDFINPCNVQVSAIPGASGYKVCKLPLGEQYVKVVPIWEYVYSYMYFVTLVPANVEACTSILTSGWEEVLPAEWWNFGRLWIGSEAGRLDIYGSSTTFNNQTIYTHYSIMRRTLSEINDDCSVICNNDLEYCTIVFDFLGYN